MTTKVLKFTHTAYPITATQGCNIYYVSNLNHNKHYYINRDTKKVYAQEPDGSWSYMTTAKVPFRICEV